MLCHELTTLSPQTPPGQGDTLIYADIGPSSGKRRPPVTPNLQDDHRVVYSTVNHALQATVPQKSSHERNRVTTIGKLNIIIMISVYNHLVHIYNYDITLQ